MVWHMGRTGRPNLIHYAIGDSHDRHRAACSAGHRWPRAKLGPWAARGPRRSCTALYEAAPPAVGPTGTMGSARAAGATRRRMHISAPPV